MKLLIYLIMRFIFLFLSILLVAESKSQDYYKFGDDFPDKGHFALTPIGGIISKSGGGVGYVASGKIHYFITDYISLGAQYIQLFDTGNEDFGWIGDYLAPEQSIHLVAGGHYFPSGKRFGFHGTAGIGYIISEGKNITSYFDIGGDYKIGKMLTLQIQAIALTGVVGATLGFQLKL